MLTGNRDVDIDILNRLNDKDLVSSCQTNKYAQSVCNDEKLWLRRSIDRFSKYVSVEEMKKFKGNRTWGEYYVEIAKILNKTLAAYDLVKAVERGRTDIEKIVTSEKKMKITHSIIKSDNYYYVTDPDYSEFFPTIQGKYIGYYLNGNKKKEGEYYYDIKKGEWKTYWQNGQLDTVHHYTTKLDFGEKFDGENLKYNEDGKLLIRELWKDGKLIDRKQNFVFKDYL